MTLFMGEVPTSWESVVLLWLFLTLIIVDGLGCDLGVLSGLPSSAVDKASDVTDSLCIQSHLLRFPTKSCGTLTRWKARANSCQPCAWKSLWCLTTSLTKSTLFLRWWLDHCGQILHGRYNAWWVLFQCALRGFQLSLCILWKRFWWFHLPWQYWFPMIRMEFGDGHNIPNSIAWFGCIVWLIPHHWDLVCPKLLSLHRLAWRSNGGYDSLVLLWMVASSSWDRPNVWF